MKKFRNSKGITTTDLIISIFIIIIFLSIMITIIYSLYIANTDINRNSVATGIMVSIMEKIELLDYNDSKLAQGEYLSTDINSLLDISIPKGYIASLKIIDYNKTEGNLDKMDLIKIIKLEIKYKVGKEEKVINIDTIKEKNV